MRLYEIFQNVNYNIGDEDEEMTQPVTTHHQTSGWLYKDIAVIEQDPLKSVSNGLIVSHNAMQDRYVSMFNKIWMRYDHMIWDDIEEDPQIKTITGMTDPSAKKWFLSQVASIGLRRLLRLTQYHNKDDFEKLKRAINFLNIKPK